LFQFFVQVTHKSKHQKIHCLFQTVGNPHPKAANRLKLSFVEYSEKMDPVISIKHDGINTYINGKNGKIYKKIDERQKDVMKARDTSILPRNEWIYVELAIYWIDIIKANDPVDATFFSAMKNIDGVLHLKRLHMTENGLKLSWIPIHEFDAWTYELLGPKTGTIVNAYEFPVVSRDIVCDGWRVDSFPEHFWVKHGDFTIKLDKSIYSELDNLREWVLKNQLEGLVFQFTFDDFSHYFKLNRGHINGKKIGLPLVVLPGFHLTIPENRLIFEQ